VPTLNKIYLLTYLLTYYFLLFYFFLQAGRCDTF